MASPAERASNSRQVRALFAFWYVRQYATRYNQLVGSRTMPKVNMISVTEARSHLAELVEKANQEQQIYHILSHSKPKAVLMAHDVYDMLMEQLEDMQDSLDVLQA